MFVRPGRSVVSTIQSSMACMILISRCRGGRGRGPRVVVPTERLERLVVGNKSHCCRVRDMIGGVKGLRDIRAEPALACAGWDGAAAHVSSANAQFGTAHRARGARSEASSSSLSLHHGQQQEAFSLRRDTFLDGFSTRVLGRLCPWNGVLASHPCINATRGWRSTLGRFR